MDLFSVVSFAANAASGDASNCSAEKDPNSVFNTRSRIEETSLSIISWEGDPRFNLNAINKP